jgi:hypothetical protein
LESWPGLFVANPAALLKDALPQFLDIIERLICVGLLRVPRERKNPDENQKSPSDGFHGGCSLLGKLYHELRWMAKGVKQ